MRLAPVPVRFHTDIKLARDIAYESSLSTHPGLMAAEACKLMAHIIVRAINRGADEKVTAAVFLDDVCEEYLTMLGPSPSGACLVIRRLLSQCVCTDLLELDVGYCSVVKPTVALSAAGIGKTPIWVSNAPCAIAGVGTTGTR
jgi:hypothetical protein